MDVPRLLITGTGAMASLFAAHLSAVGVRVGMLGSWPAGLIALRSDGVRMETQEGKLVTFPVDVISETERCIPYDFALVLVKSWQTERTAAQLAGCLAPAGVALTLQNGHGNYEALSAVLGQERVALGVTTAGATLIGPGFVRAGGRGYIKIGSHPRIAPLLTCFRSAGFDAAETADTDSLVWSKLVINAAINPLTAIFRLPNGDLLARPSLRKLMGQLAEEAAAVAAARGTSLAFTDPVRETEDVARRTAANHSSMYQDVARGAPTEVDAICGAIVREGLIHDVPTPVNQVVWDLVRAAAWPPGRAEN